jgi:hypothetical protein
MALGGRLFVCDIMFAIPDIPNEGSRSRGVEEKRSGCIPHSQLREVEALQQLEDPSLTGIRACLITNLFADQPLRGLGSFLDAGFFSCTSRTESVPADLLSDFHTLRNELNDLYKHGFGSLERARSTEKAGIINIARLS